MRFDYNSLTIQTNCNAEKPVVKVFWNSCFLNPVFATTSIDQAMRWVDAYHAGEKWAVDAMRPAKVG